MAPRPRRRARPAPEVLLLIARLTRRALLARSARLAVGAATLPLLAAAPLAHARKRPGEAERAVAVYRAMQANFYIPERQLYRETYPHRGGNAYSFLWPYTEASAGTLDLLGVPKLAPKYAAAARNRRAGFEAYWHPRSSPPAAYDSYVRPPLGRGGDRYYDDNAWVGRALVQYHRLTGDRAALERAETLFAFSRSGWDDDPNHTPRGGVFWVEAKWNRHRGTGATAGAAKQALHLYELTGRKQPTYLEWAGRLYGWVRQHLLDAKTGLYYDKVLDFNGAVDPTHWAYNQGVMIAAGALFHRLTGDDDYLGRAEQTAAAMLARYARLGFTSQPAIFNVLFFRNLLLLHEARPDAEYLAAMREYADQVWNDRAHLHPKRKLYRDPYDSEGSDDYQLLDQAALVQLYACLAWPAGAYSKLA